MVMEENRFKKTRQIMITEEQYKRIFLGEESHHPHYLDEFNRRLSDKIISTIRGMVKSNTSYKTIIFDGDNFLYRALEVNISIYADNQDINDPKNYPSTFFSGRLDKDGKLEKATINIWVPFTTEGHINEECIRSVVFHETMHLDDDRTNQINGLSPISLHPTTQKNYDLMADKDIQRNRIAKDLAALIYCTSRFERKAYLAQVLNELSRVGCNWQNFRTAMTNTVPYRNMRLTADSIIEALDSAEDGDVEKAVALIREKTTNSNLPDPKKISGRDLKEKLARWTESEYRKFLKKYAGATMHFLDEMPQTNDFVSI